MIHIQIKNVHFSKNMNQRKDGERVLLYQDRMAEPAACQKNLGTSIIKKIQHSLVVGKHYMIPRAWIKNADLSFYKMDDLSFELVAKLPRFVLFRSSAGICTCFRYIELAKVIGKTSEE